MNVVSLFITLLILRLTAALPCLRGTFASNTTSPCEPCLRGTYQPVITLIPTPCRRCPPGTYFPFRRGRGIDVCMRCPENTFSTARAATSMKSCRPCPPGMVSAPGSGICYPPCNECQLLRPSGCEACIDGNMPVNGMCTRRDFQNGVCLNGTRQTCPPGTEPGSIFMNGCRECGRSFRQASVSPNGERCQKCPAGLVANAARTKCMPCPAGMAVESLRPVCIRCPPGQNTNGSRPVCVADGTQCPSNFFEDSSGNCNTCSPGERFDPENRKCVKCAENEWSPGGIPSSCGTCGKNQVGGAVCECREGFRRDLRNACVPCPAGTFYSRFQCVDCPIGLSSEPGSAECTLCPAGTAKPERGPSTCVECKDGLVASTLRGSEYPSTEFVSFPERSFGRFGTEAVSRSDCVNPRTNCAPHLQRVSDGAGNFFCEPRSCPSGTLMKFIKPRGRFNGNVRVCVSCAPGSVFQFETCQPCRAREISAGGLATECVDCPIREARSGLECACDEPFRRSRVRDKQGVCQDCPPGTTTGFLRRDRRCARCPRGTSASRPGSASCRLCESGTVEVGRRRCTACPAGFVSFGVRDATCVKVGGDDSS